MEDHTGGQMAMTPFKNKHKFKLTSFQTIIFGFLGAIGIGALLLMLPFATVSGHHASFHDAVFTATSATCVTGLVVQDTGTYWSMFGQFVILLLIQIGGMGVITIAGLIAIASGKKIGLMQRNVMKEALSAKNVGGIVRLTSFIVKCTFLIELAGALLLFPVFYQEYGVARGLWYAIFHSVSAFCNAGFDLMGVQSPYTSLCKYVSQPLVNIVIMLLIIVGGIGFLTWEDIARNRWHMSKYSTQTKMILFTTATLILVPAIFLFCCEFDGLALKDRIFASLFQSITTRTAGFNTMELNGLSDVGKMMMILLMLIGGSPGSTAGGMKTTTIAVLLASAFAIFHQHEDTSVFRRRIAEETIRTASAIFMMYLILFLFGGCILSMVEGLPLLDCLFETASAIGTVGLTLGITTQLSLFSRYLLVALMFFGRVGGLTLIFATTRHLNTTRSHLPKDKINVG